MRPTDFLGVSLVILSVSVLTGCAGGGTSVARDIDADTDARAKYERALRLQVREDVEAARRKADSSGAELFNFKPYFYKEFHDYPDGPDDFEIEFIETESKVTPLVADVSLTKLRFVTEVSRDRTTARADDDFRREVGIETRSYELRNGQWRQVASLYVTDDIRELAGGEWVPLQEKPRDAFLSPSDRTGFFRRAWDRVRFNDDELPAAP